MTDRFLGFRFEISLDYDNDSNDGDNDDEYPKALIDDIVGKSTTSFLEGAYDHIQYLSIYNHYVVPIALHFFVKIHAPHFLCFCKNLTRTRT